MVRSVLMPGVAFDLSDPARVRPSEVRVSYGSYEKARRAFGFEPATDMEKSIRAMWDHAMNEAA